jgi:hypothetical protein
MGTTNFNSLAIDDLTIGSTAISEAELGMLDAGTPGTMTAGKALVPTTGGRVNSLWVGTLSATLVNIGTATLNATHFGVLAGQTLACNFLTGVTAATTMSTVATSVSTDAATLQTALNLAITSLNQVIVDLKARGVVL